MHKEARTDWLRVMGTYVDEYHTLYLLRGYYRGSAVPQVVLVDAYFSINTMLSVDVPEARAQLGSDEFFVPSNDRMFDAEDLISCHDILRGSGVCKDTLRRVNDRDGEYAQIWRFTELGMTD